jgi:hypothetical protein
MALAWVLTDLFLLFALEEHLGVVERRDRPVEMRDGADGIRGWTAFLSLGGAVALGLALVVWQGSPGGVEGRVSVAHDGPLAVLPVAILPVAILPVAVLAVLAAVLRLLPYPLPGWQSSGSSQASSPLTRLMPYLVTALSGAYLWSRLLPRDVAGQGGAEVNSTLLVVLALWAGLAMLASALKAWIAPDPGRLIASTSIYGIALVLLGAGLGLPASWQRLVGASASLSVCALYVSWTQCQYLDIADFGSYWRAVWLLLAGCAHRGGRPLPVRAAPDGWLSGAGRDL